MRDLSPDYLTRFMSYVDTLLTLDHADKKSKPMAKKPLTPKTARKPKAVTVDPGDAPAPARQR